MFSTSYIFILPGYALPKLIKFFWLNKLALYLPDVSDYEKCKFLFNQIESLFKPVLS